MKKIFVTIIILFFSSTGTMAQTDYERFGGKKMMIKVINDFVSYLMADNTTKPFFKKLRGPRRIEFKLRLSELFCKALDGDCIYKGLSMKQSHRKLKINQSHFYRLVELLQISMEQNRVSQSLQNKLLSRLAALHKDIITN